MCTPDLSIFVGPRPVLFHLQPALMITLAPSVWCFRCCVVANKLYYTLYFPCKATVIAVVRHREIVLMPHVIS